MRILSLFCCLASSSLFALAYHPFNELEPIEIDFSSEQINRIKLEGSEVYEVVYPEEVMEVSKDELSGQVFVKLLDSDYEGQPLQLTLTTSEGLIQDLILNFQEQPRELLILQEPKQESKTEKEEASQHHDWATLDSFLRGEEPVGFLERALYSDERGFKFKGLLKLRLQRVCEAPEQKLELWELENAAEHKVFLSELQLVEPGVDWVYFADLFLQPGQKTTAVILRGTSS